MTRSGSVAAIGAAVLIAACASGPGAREEVVQPASTSARPVVLDAFEDVAPWRAAPATGVEMRLADDEGFGGGRALRVDFDFRGGGGWAAFGRELPVRLPENYELSFWLRGDAPTNTLELKLIDESGENVWWVNRPNFEFRGDWRRVTFRRRHVTFAWGPAGGGEIRDVAALEFAVTAGQGGRGTIWLDSLTLTPREPVLPYDLVPIVSASSGTDAAAVLDTTGGAWRSAAAGEQHITLDFRRAREYGGLIVHWDSTARARDYDVEVSADGSEWRVVRQVRGGAGPRDYLFLPESESRWLRLRLLRAAGDRYAIRSLRVQPIEWAESRNNVFETMAADAPRGYYPKYFRRVQSYWTLVGVNGAAEEALINEEGAVEVGKRAFSIEPFLRSGDRLWTWADASITQSLLHGYLPIPGVHWEAGDLRLDVTAWADGAPEASRLWLRYRVRNTGAAPRTATLYLAVRPFQVNPSWQFLNNPGGAALVRDIAWDGSTIRVDDRQVVPLTPPSAFGAATFDAGGIVPHLAAGRLPAHAQVRDEFGHASAALAYALQLEPGTGRDVVLLVPLRPGIPPGPLAARVDTMAAARLREAERAWRGELDRFVIDLPPQAPPLGALVRSNLAYVLLNRDGAAIQPGSRSYERSWIRDGSLTSAALLRLGHERVVREFIDWYAPYQYENGKVPCCVDARGADPVPEHDSHGQLIYLIAEYFRFTGDTALVRERWRNVSAAVAHIDSLRHLRMTDVYRTPDSLAYFGMVPQSISHEGYSAKPMHSYWDAFFVLRGLKDATYLAGVLKHGDEQARFERIRDDFRRDLHQSLRRSMAAHNIDYLPGSVELGDFDATSTTIGVTPAGELDALRSELLSTFERYWQNFSARRDGTLEWEAYTPYELRTVGTFVHLGQRRRAHEALAWFLRDVRPRPWNHWAEVVFHDEDAPRFIGDMPHGWVGSDFIRSVTDMFAYAAEDSDEVVVGAGVLPEWLTPGDSVRVRGLRTPHGTVGYTMRRTAAGVEVTFEPGVAASRVTLHSPLEQPLRSVSVDGRTARSDDDVVRLGQWPRRVLLRY